MGQTRATAIARRDAERVFEAISRLLHRRGWYPERSETGHIRINPDGRSERELALLKAWVSSLTAVEHCGGGSPVLLDPEIAALLEGMIKSAEKVEKALQARRAGLAEEDGSWSPRLLAAERELRRATLTRLQLTRSLRYAQWYRGARSITNGPEWELFLRMLCTLLPDYGLSNREIARIVYGRDDEYAVGRVKSRRGRVKKKQKVACAEKG